MKTQKRYIANFIVKGINREEVIRGDNLRDAYGIIKMNYRGAENIKIGEL